MALLGTLLKPGVDKLAAREDVTGLVEVLVAQRKPELRARAAAALGRLGDTSAVSALVSALTAEPVEVAAAAQEALRAFGVRAGRELADTLGSEDGAAAGRAVELLVACGEGAAEHLVATLKGGDARARERGAAALIRLWPQIQDAAARETAFRGLLAALGDRLPAIRTAAAEQLGTIADPRAGKALAACLKDGDAAVREAARTALGRIGAAVVPFLVDALRDRNTNSRLGAARLLGETCPGCESLEPLREAAEALTLALEDREETIRAAAAEALARLPPPPPVEEPAEPEEEGAEPVTI